MSNSLLGFLRRQYICVLRKCALKNVFTYLVFAGAAALPVPMAMAQSVPTVPVNREITAVMHSVPDYAGAIIADGSTQTHVAVNGATTGITTDTISGANAFNSFDRFNILTGQTVNLYLPGGTSNLINVVHNERSDLNGVMNAYKDGRIGGNIYFLNPHGIVVGSQGILNVGSLTLATPTQGFADDLISAQGVVNDGNLNYVLSGKMPLTDSGLIQVKGRINAAEQLNIFAGQVDIRSGAYIATGPQAYLAFKDIVNIDGIAPATGVVVENGVVHITSAGDTTIAGTVSADGAAGQSAGSIDIHAGGDVHIADNAVITASGQGANSSGGNILVYGDHNADLGQGARIAVNAGTSGDGGKLELSAHDTVTITGGKLEASAVNGKGGSVLIDPADLSWTGNGSDVFSDGADYEIAATNSVTLNDVYVSTRKVAAGDATRANILTAASTGNSGKLVVKAPKITLKNSVLLANADHGFTAGDVNIVALHFDFPAVFGDSNAEISIENSTIKGDDVTITSVADNFPLQFLLDNHSLLSAADAQAYLDDKLKDPAGTAAGAMLTVTSKAIAKTTLLGTTVLGGGKVAISANAGARTGFKKEATADVVIGDSTTKSSLIQGADISIGSATSTSLSFNILGSLLKLADQSWLPDPDSPTTQFLDDQIFDFNGVPIVALSTSKASTTVSGATVLTATNTLSVDSQSESNASPTFSSPLLFSAAWGESTSDAKTLVGGTTHMTSGNKTSVTASNDVVVNVTASVNSTNKPIDATFVMLKSSITTSAVVGDQTVTNAGSLDVTAKTEADLLAGASSKNAGGSGVGLAVAVKLTDSTTTATLGGTATTTSGDAVVSATTDLANNDTSADAATLGNPSSISAKIANFQAKLQGGILGKVLTSTGKLDQAKADKVTGFLFPGIKEGKLNISGAVSYTDSTNTATASIADNAVVKSAGKIDVLAKVTDRPSASVGAKSSSTGTAIGGSVDLADFTDNANAFIGKNAIVDAKKAITVDAQTYVPYPWAINWQSPEDVYNYLTGGIANMFLTSYAINSAKGKSGAGLAVAVNLFSIDTNSNAYIDTGAKINTFYTPALQPSFDLSQQSLTVHAKNEVNMVNAVGIASTKLLGTSGGKAAVGGSGNIVDVSGTAIAGIRDNAEVNANKTVNVKAETVNELVTVTEAGGSSDSVGIEGAVSINTITDTTIAYIDDKVKVKTGGDVNVEANGDIKNISVAGGVVTTKGPVGIGMSVSLNTINSDVEAYVGNHDPVGDLAPSTGTIATDGNLNDKAISKTQIGAYSIVGAVATDSKAQTDVPSDAGETKDGAGSAAGAGGTGKGKFGIAVSGDASVNDITADTLAYVSGVKVTKATDTILTATNTLAINALAGAAAISTKADGNGLAGSYAQNNLGGETKAFVDNAELTLSGDLKLNAAVDGNIKTLSASIGAAKGKLGVAGSVSVNQISHQTSAYLNNSAVTAAKAAEITANNLASIQSVAGALGFGGKAGIGLSFAWNEMDNDTWAYVKDSDLETSQGTKVTAKTDNQIDTITAALGASSGKMAAAGSVSVNTIGNSTEAYVSGKKTAKGLKATGVEITAEDDSTINAISGSLGASAGQVGIGAAVAWSDVGNTVDASIRDDANVEATAGNVALKATAATDVFAVAAAGGVADKVAISGSFSAVETDNTTTARISGTPAKKPKVKASGQITADAKDDATINSNAGSISASGTAALGVAGAYTVIDNTTEAKAENAELTAAGTRLEAKEEAEMTILAIAGGASSNAAIAGSLGVNTITNTTKATSKDTKITVSGDALIHAIDTSTISSRTGSVSVSGSVAVGAAGAYNKIGGETTAQISGGQADATNVNVKSEKDSTVEAIAVSGGVSGDVAAAGSFGYNELKGETKAIVDGGAKVTAQNNVGVIADTNDKIRMGAGSLGIGIEAVGIGATIAVNNVQSTTTAHIDGATTQVTALAKNSADTLSVNSGDLTAGVDLAKQADIGTYAKLDLKSKKAKENVTGLAVNAASSEHVENVSANVSGSGGVAAGLVTSIDIIGGSTSAYVKDAQLNLTNTGAGSGQQVAIKSSNIAYGNSFVGNVSVGAGAGGVATDLHTVSRTTTAYTEGGSVTSNNKTSVKAKSLQGVSSLAVGGAAGGIAGAGTLSLTMFDNTTDAHVDGTKVVASDLDITANNTNNTYVANGAVAIGGTAAGGAFAVSISDSTTRATLKNATGANRVDVSGAVNVLANTKTDTQHIVISAAGGGATGVAGMADVNLVTDTTEALIDNSDVGASADKVGSVHVVATHDLDINSVAGALGLGFSPVGAGVGAGASVNIIKARTTATLDDSHVYASGQAEVKADSTKSVDATALTAGAGGTVGIGGAAVITLIGDDVTGDSADEVNKGGTGTLSKINSFASVDRFSGAPNTGTNSPISSSDKASISAATNTNVAAVTNGSAKTFRTGAEVTGTGSINSGSISVVSTDKTDSKTLVGGLGVSLGGGIGGGVAVTSVKANVDAQVAGPVTTNGDVVITATADNDSGKTIDDLAIAGGAGLVGIGAAVVVADVSNTVDASFSGSANTGSGSLKLTAADNTDISADAKGAAVGAAAAGIVVSQASKTSTVSAHTTGSVTGGGTSIVASGSGQVKAVGQAAAGGLLASGAGALVTADDDSHVTASTADNSTFTLGSGKLSVTASVTPQTEAQADGISVSAGLGIGASEAKANVNASATAQLGASNTVTAGELAVLANQLRNGSAETAKASAFAAGGGLLFGAGATTSDARTLVTVSTAIGNNSTLTLGTGKADIIATSDNLQYAKASGVNGGIIAAGFNTSNASSETTTTSALGTNVKISGGNLTVKADGKDDNEATTTAGSGGIVSGAAAVANTNSKSTTTATVGNSQAGRTIDVTAFNLQAQHTATFNSFVDSTNASVVGASGAYAHNKVEKSTVKAEIGDNVTVNAANVDIKASNKTRKAAAVDFNVRSASGGLFDAAATHSDTIINNDTDVVIGQKTNITAQKPGFDQGSFNVTAGNDLEVFDSAIMDSGGAVALAKAESYITSDQNDADITVGSGSVLSSDNTLTLESVTKAHVDTEVQSKTYGLAGAAQGDSIARIGTSNNIKLDGARLVSDESIVLNAGQNNDLNADAETRLWNRTAFPVETSPDALGQITQNNKITINAYVPATGSAPQGSTSEDQIARSAVAAVKDIALNAGEGTHITRGYGRGTDLYRELLANAANLFGANISLDITGGSTSDVSNSSVLNNGTLFAGTHFHQFLTIDAAGNIVKQSEGIENPVLTLNVDLGRDIDARINALTALYNEYKNDKPDIANGFKADIDILNAKKAQLGVGAHADFFHIKPIAAYTGNIAMHGDTLTGSGEIIAPGDSKIEIVNNSSRFIVIDNPGPDHVALLIPPDIGGIVSLNGVRVSSTADIANINQGNVASNFSTILDRGNSPDPSILIKNTYTSSNPSILSPEIHVDGDISNLRGLAKLESTGSIQVSADIGAKTVDIATKGDFIQTFKVGISDLGGRPDYSDSVDAVSTTLEAQATTDHPIAQSRPTNQGTVSVSQQYTRNSLTVSNVGSTVAGNNVFISGEKLNINGIIQSGVPVYNVTIDSTLANNAITHPGTWIDIPQTVGGVALNSVFLPKVRWNTATQQLELSNISVGGGYMQLYGDIFSTGNGQLRVLDGYGQITVNNTTSYNLKTNQLDTGPYVAGHLKITDTSMHVANGDALVTDYTRVNGQMVVTDNATSHAAGSPRGQATGARTAVYNPTANRRYFWINGSTATVTNTQVYTTEVTFGVDWLAADTDDPDRTTQSTPIYTARLSGNWLGNDSRSADYILDYTKISSPVVKTRDEETDRDCVGASGACLHEEITNEKDFKWTEYSYFVNSLAASKSVAINFIGADTGSLSVTAANSKLELGANVRNLSGATTMSAKDITSADLATVNVKNLNLTATAGGIGSASTTPGATQYVKTDILSGGVFTANATGGGIALHEVDGAMAVSHVQATGVVDLRAEADMTQSAASNVVTVSGSSIRLSSDDGAIGSAATPLLIDTTSSTGNVGGHAAKSITLTENTGDLRLDDLGSLGGDITLTAKTGNIIDDNAASRADVEASSQLLAVADRAGLRGSAADASQANTVKGYNQAMVQDYARYWQMRNVHKDGTGAYVADAYNPAFAFHLSSAMVTDLKTNQGWTDTMVAQYEARQTTFYHDANAKFGGQAFAANYSYNVQTQDNATYLELIAGAKWSDQQITNKVAAGIFKDTADTNVLIENANVTGRNITLTAANGGIGAEKSARVISFVNPSAWTDDERLALVAADRNDVVIDYAAKTITIRQKDDINLTLRNSGSLTASAGSDIYLGSEDDVRVKSVVSGANDEVRIKTGASLYSVAAAGAAAVTGHDVTLEAGGGDLGTDNAVFVADIGGNLTARAKRDLYLKNLSGDIRVEQIFAGNLASVTSVGGIVEDPLNHNFSLDVLAKYISLSAATTIGEDDVTGEKALDIATSPDGWADLVAPDGVFVWSPRAINLRNVTVAHGILRMNSGANDLRVTGGLFARDGIALHSDMSILLGSAANLVSSDGNIDLTSTGYWVDAASSDPTQYGLKMDGGARITANTGNVLITTDYAQVIAGDIDAGGHVDLNSGTDIRMVGGSIRSDGYISAHGGNRGTGNILIGPKTGGGYAIDTASDLDLTAPDSITITGLIKTGGHAILGTAGDITLGGGALTSTGPVTLAAGTDGTGKVIGLVGGTGPHIAADGEVTIEAPDAIGDGSPLFIKAGAPVTLTSKVIKADVAALPASNPLLLNISGQGGLAADTVALHVASTDSVTLNTFNVNVADVVADTPSLKVPNGQIGNYATFTLPTYNMRIDTISRDPHPEFDVTSFTLSGKFAVDAKLASLKLDAFVLKSDPKLPIEGAPPGTATGTLEQLLTTLQAATNASGADDGTSPASDDPKTRKLIQIKLDWMKTSPQIIPNVDAETSSVNP